MTPTRTDVLDRARSQLGYREGAGNATKYGRWFGLLHAAWCAMFVSWCFAQEGGTAIGGRFASTRSHAAWFKSKGRWGTKPRSGAVAFFDFPGDGRPYITHEGLVEGIHADGRVICIEGNTSDQVARRIRARSSIVGYGYPAYAPGPKAPAPAPDKYACTITSLPASTKTTLRIAILGWSYFTNSAVRLTFQRKVAGKWTSHSTQMTRTRKGAHGWSKVVNFAHPGTYRVRANNAKRTSAWKTIAVK